MFGMPVHFWNATTAYGNLSFKTVKRAAPTISNGTPRTLYHAGAVKTITSIAYGTAGNVIYSANIAITGSGYAAGAAGHYDVNAYLWIDSEL